MEQNTKISFEHYGTKFMVEFPSNEIDLLELLNSFKGLVIAAGYQNESWENVILQLSEELQKPKKQFDFLSFLRDIDNKDECN